MPVLGDIHLEIVHQLPALPAFGLVDDIRSVGQLFRLRKTVLIADENIALGILCRVIVARSFQVDLELCAFLRGFYSCFPIVAVFDDGDVAFDDLFRHIVGGVIQLNGIKLRLRAHMVDGGIHKIALAGIDFTDRPVGIADIIAGGELAIFIRGKAVDEGIALIQPIGGAGKRAVALGCSGFHIALGDGDAELFEDIVHGFIRDLIPFDDSRLGIRHHIADGGIRLLQHIARADQHVFKPCHPGGIRHRVLIHRQAGEGCAGQVEGHALRQTVLAGLGNFQTAALENIVKGHSGCLAADDGDALGGLGFVFVNGLLGYGVNAGIEVGNVDFPCGIGGFGGVISLAGDSKGNPLHLAILGSFDQLHISGFHFQIEVAHHLVGNRRAVGGKVLGATPGHAVRPDHHAAALGADLFRFHGYRAFEGLAGRDGELAAVYGKIQPCGAAGKGVVPQHSVGICEGGRILFPIPFQLIGPRVGGAAEKAGQHGVALHRAFNRGILAENLAA